jgi:hypothetical protein
MSDGVSDALLCLASLNALEHFCSCLVIRLEIASGHLQIYHTQDPRPTVQTCRVSIEVLKYQ